MLNNLKKLQKEIYQHKIKQGFNVKDIEREFCYIYGELAEAYEAYRKKLPDLGEEIADVVIYLLSLAEILGIDLGTEIEKKMAKNKRREYKRISGVLKRTKEG